MAAAHQQLTTKQCQTFQGAARAGMSEACAARGAGGLAAGTAPFCSWPAVPDSSPPLSRRQISVCYYDTHSQPWIKYAQPQQAVLGAEGEAPAEHAGRNTGAKPHPVELSARARPLGGLCWVLSDSPGEKLLFCLEPKPHPN
jgi:hypothetical protein